MSLSPRLHSLVRVVVALALTLATSGVLLPGRAVAQDPSAQATPIDPDTEFTRAQEAFAAGRYEEALAALERVYEVEPDPVVVYNIGRCHQELGHWSDADFAFNVALGDLNFPEQLRQEAMQHSEFVSTKLAEQKAEQPAPGQDPPEEAPSDLTEQLLAWGPWILMGVGGVLFVSGGINAIALQSTVDDFHTARDACERRGESCDEAFRLGDEVDSGNLASNILLISGVLIAGAGVAWWLWPRDPEPAPAALLVPVEGGAVLGVSLPIP